MKFGYYRKYEMSFSQLYSIFPKQFLSLKDMILLTAHADNLSGPFIIIFLSELKAQGQREAYHMVISNAEAIMISFIVYINIKITKKLKNCKIMQKYT